MIRSTWRLLVVLTALAALSACKKAEESTGSAEKVATVAQAAHPSRGVGPIKEVQLGPLNPDLAQKGQAIFEQKCSPCHRPDERFVGPAVRGVTKRRTPEWIMNMVLNPVEMTQKDPTAQELLATYLTQMTFQNVSEEDARAILEYFRQLDSGGA